MKIIEVLGPSGVGKTTLLREAAAFSSAHGALSSWLGPDALDQLIAPLLQNERDSLDAPQNRAFINLCLSQIAQATMLPSQKLRAGTILAAAARRANALSQLSDQPGSNIWVHDELLLHRAFSYLFHARDLEGAARLFFSAAPKPFGAIVVRAPLELLIERTNQRQPRPNCYYGLEGDALVETLRRALHLVDVAADCLQRQSVPVCIVDGTGDPGVVAANFLAAVREIEVGK